MDTVKLGRNGPLSLPKAVMKRLHLRGNEILRLEKVTRTAVGGA